MILNNKVPGFENKRFSKHVNVCFFFVLFFCFLFFKLGYLWLMLGISKFSEFMGNSKGISEKLELHDNIIRTCRSK